MRAARHAARTPREFVEDAYRANFGFIVEDAARAAFLSRNASTIRALFQASEGPAGIGELAEDLRAAIARGEMPPVDVDYCAGGDGRGRARARPAARGARSARRRGRDELRHAAVPRRDRGRLLTRTRLLVAAVCAALLALAAPAAAPAALRIGIAENNPSVFSDPLFQALGAKYTRVVVSWNAMTSGTNELQRVADYVAAAAGRARPAARHLRARARQCGDLQAALEAAQEAVPASHPEAVRAQLQALPGALPVRQDVRALERDQPLHAADISPPEGGGALHRHRAPPLPRLQDRRGRHPRTRPHASAKRPSYRSTLLYIKRFKRALKAPRTICGLHNYSDTNRFRDRGTRTIIKALRCKEIWLTETGGIFKFASFKASQKRQLRATRYMFKLAKRPTAASSASTSTRGSAR